jgi:hypothetical protein
MPSFKKSVPELMERFEELRVLVPETAHVADSLCLRCMPGTFVTLV